MSAPAALKSPNNKGLLRLARGFYKLLKLTLATALIAAGLLASLLVALNIPRVRGWALREANSALAGQFRGKLEIERAGYVGLNGACGVDAHVTDAAGRRVLVIRGLRVSLDVPRLLWQVIARKNLLEIRLSHVAFDDARVDLLDDGSGSPTLASAFLPRTSAPSAPSSGRTTQVIADDIHARHIWVRGGLSALPVIDADLAQLRAGFQLDSQRARLDIHGLELTGRGLPMALDPRGKLVAHAALPLSEGQALDASAHFEGQVLESDCNADAALTGDELTANVAASLSPAARARLGMPGAAPLKVEARLQGELTAVHVVAQVAGARTHLELTGVARVSAPQQGSFELRAEPLDLSEFFEGAPVSTIALESHASVQVAAAGGVFGSYELAMPRARLAANALPASNLRGTFEQPPGAAPFQLRGEGVIHEPGAETRFDGVLHAGQHVFTELATHTVLDKPARLRALGVSVSGSLDARARVELDSQSVALSTSAALDSVAAPSVRAARVKLRATAQGRLGAPQISAVLDADQIRAAGHEFRNAELRALGPPSAIVVSGTARGDDDLSLEWGATVHAAPGLSIRGATLGVARGRLAQTVRVGRLELSRGLELEQVVLDGSLGHVEGSLAVRDGVERIDLDARNVDVARVRELLKVDPPMRAGIANLQAHYEPGGGGHGFVRGDVSGIALGRLTNVSLHADASLEHGVARGSVSADLADSGRLTLDAGELDLPRHLASEQDFQQLAGSVHAYGDVELAALRELLADPAVPLERARGHVDFDLALERAAGTKARPTVKARVSTRGLYLVGKRHDDAALETVSAAKQAEPWALADMDFQLSTALLPDGKLSLQAQAIDKIGVLATLDGSAELPEDLFEHPGRALQMPVEAKLSVPPRELASLPSIVRPASEAGRADLDVSVAGTFNDPVIVVKGNVAHLHDLDSQGGSLDLRLSASYARTHGEVDAQAYRKEQQIAALHAAWQGELAELSRRSPDAQSPVTGSALLELSDFPIGVVPGAHALQVRGRLSGKMELAEYGQDATLSADMHSETLRVGTSQLGRFQLSATGGQGELRAVAHLAEGDGQLSLESQGNMVWGNRIAPSSIRANTGKLQATNFRIAAFAPFVQGSLSELDGRLSADLSATIDQGSPQLQGRIDFSKGTVQLPQLGQRFEQIGFNAQVTANTLKIDNLVAHGTTGKLTATAGARMAGLEVLDADAHVAIQRDDKLPVTLEGQAIGDAWGNVDVTYRPGDAHRSPRLVVNVPRLHVELPETSTHSVIELDPNKDVRTGVWRDDGKFVTMPVQPLRKKAPGPAGPPLLVDLKLGNDVVVKKGAEADAQIDGALQLVTGGDTKANGELRLRGGSLDVSGKEFKIESGTITFNGGDPSNPTVVATARWDSPVDYLVYADFVGPVQKGKLTLHTEPPLTQDQILSLIMFGTPDGSFGSSQGSGGTAGTAIGVAGGTATAGLNRAIAGVTKLDVTTRVDTSSGSARPEIAVQVSPRVSARVSRAVGDPNPGEPPDRTFLTLDFRLKSRWSLSTLVGDHGESQLDLIWRKRY